MKFKVFTLLALLAMLLGMAACSEKATPTPTATATCAGYFAHPFEFLASECARITQIDYHADRSENPLESTTA